MVKKAEVTDSLCEAILAIDGAYSCTIFDSTGRMILSRGRPGSSDTYLDRNGPAIGGVLIGGLRSVEPFAGRTRRIIVAFERFTGIAISTDEGLTVVAMVPPNADVDAVCQRIGSELHHVGLVAA